MTRTIDSEAQHKNAPMYFARQATLKITGHADEVTTRAGRLIARFGVLEIELQDAAAHPAPTDVLTIEADLVEGRWRAASVLGLRAFRPTSAHKDEGAHPNAGLSGARTDTVGVGLGPRQATAAASPFASLANGGKGPVRAAATSAAAPRTAAPSAGRGPAPSRAATAADRGGLNAGARVVPVSPASVGSPVASPAPTPYRPAAPQGRPGFDPDSVDDLSDDLPF